MKSLAMDTLQEGAQVEYHKVAPIIKQVERVTTRVANLQSIQQFLKVEKTVEQETEKDIHQIVKSILDACIIENRLLLEKLALGLQTAESLIQTIKLSQNHHVSWTSIDQFTKKENQLVLPQMIINDQPMMTNISFDHPTPIVDQVQQMTNMTCTIFQKMNDQGDMLRIATNVKKLDGQRAIGTYIPAVQPDGTPNIVVNALLKGETYRGKAFVVNAWYLTVYKPVYDKNQRLVGALYVGIPMEGSMLKKIILNGTIGKSGYAFIMDSTGELKVHPQERLVGKNTISDLKLDTFKTILDQREEGNIKYHRYFFQGHNKFAAYTYYPERDWIIVVTGNWDDFIETEYNRSKDAVKADLLSTYETSTLLSDDESMFMFNAIELIDKNGSTQFSLKNGNYQATGENYAKKAWFNDVKTLVKNDHKNMGVQLNPETRNVEMIIVSPIYADNLWKGLIKTHFNWDLIWSVIKQHQFGETGYAYILNESDMFVSHPVYTLQNPLDFTQPRFHSLKNFVEQTMMGSEGCGSYDFEGTEKLTCFKPLKLGDNNYTLAATIPIDEVLSIANQIKDSAENEYQMIFRTIVFILVLCIFLSVTIGYFISRNLSTSIIDVVEFSKNVAKGNLCGSLSNKGKDEIGQMSKALNQMVDNLAVMFKQIAQGVQTLNLSSNGLSDISMHLSASADLTLNNSRSVATATEQMSANMVTVSASVDKATTNVGIVATATEEMKSTLRNIAVNSEHARAVTRKAVTQANSASTRVEELGQVAKGITAVTETINEISEQTNLLALNATIEAARAGDAGKGFVVVANEIKELSKQTAQSTEEIKAQIENIQKSTNTTVTEIEQISKVIQDVNDTVTSIAAAIEQQSTAINDIAQNMSQASQELDETSGNVNQTADVSKIIAQDVDQVFQSAKDISTNSDAVNASVVSLKDLAKQLNGMVENFCFDSSV